MSLNVEHLLTDHIDLWTSAIENKSSAGRGSSRKQTLYGIKKLRELILELAVRGKLVPQDPNDEPASELLKRIEAERDQLVKEGKIKKPKKLPEISDEEKPFELPEGWVWVRLGNLGIVASSSRVHKKDWLSNGIPFYRAREIIRLSQNGYVDNELFISETLFEELTKSGNTPQENDLMITGVGTIGVPYIVRSNDRFYFKDASVLIFKNHYSLYPTFIHNFMKSPFWKGLIHEGSMGTTVHTLTIARANTVLVPFAPLREQHRIVAKVDELMALCDQLEQQTEQQLDAHQQLVDTLLDTLTQSQNADELADNWARLSEHFDTLFTTEASIDQLKQTILQLAVMGKLVPQNPNDEPASELLKRIAAEKAQLIKDGKIKKQKPLPPISEEEKPFKLPEGWEWVRLDDICYGVTSGSTPPKDVFSEETGIPYLKVYNIRNQNIDFNYKKQFITAEYHSTKLKRSSLYPGDVLMNIVGPPLGKIAIIPDDYPEWNCNQAIVFFRPIVKEINLFLYSYLCAGLFLERIELIGTAGQDNISVTKSRSIVFPLLSLSEQGRIVTKINELFTLCDQLKERLAQSQQTQLQLTDTLVTEALH
ncbi:restriction endonuclease subunit S [Neptunomonas sp.]|uniref:restriction endonuclease subunit S n=1 Tax=Neptunomonas TaxID=75687 RepID=UPI003513702C